MKPDSEHLTRVILDQMYQFVGLLDSEGRVLEINKTALDAAGLKLEDIQGLPFWLVPTWGVTEDNPKKVEQAFHRAASGEFVREELDLFAGAAGTQVVTIDFSLKPIRDENQKIIFFLAEGRNITEKKIAEAEVAKKNRDLHEANLRLIEAARAKSEFFATVSHELRTPLTLVLAPLETLLKETSNLLPSRQANLLHTMHKNAISLLQMITGLLDYSKLQAGRWELKREPIQIGALTRSILTDFGPLMQAKSIQCELDIRVAEDVVVSLDRYLFERILFNLLSNAVKFTPSGGVICVRLDLNAGKLRLTVKDSGIGISGSDRAKIFERFSQIDSSSTRRFEGTGLGLALVKEFTQLLGGSVTLESELGKGSEFTLECDAPLSSEKASQDSDKSQLGHLAVNAAASWEAGVSNATAKVLIVEDNTELSNYMSSVLGELARIRVATDGEMALSDVETWLPDLVLTDVMIPVLDGFELCRRIKLNPRISGIPVVMVTALTHREALMKGWESGADDYLFKPFHPGELVVRVRSLLRMVEARKNAEEEKRRRKELEEFSYIASHDLKEPIRIIKMYSEVMRSRLQGVADMDLGESCGFVIEGASRLEQLVSGLIEYAEAGQTRPSVPVDCNHALELALASLKFEILEHKAAIDSDVLPMVSGNLPQISQLFQNLLTNALKYRDQTVPRIHIASQKREGEWLISVKDNGIGFEQKYAERIFLICKRLHDRSTYPGAGVGLAISKAIVERHGGRIWANSEPGKGATFHFTLTANN